MIARTLALPKKPDAAAALDRVAALATAEFRSETAEILAAKPPLAARLTVHAVAGLVVSSLVLATVLPIERVVTARGRIVSTAPKIEVQPLETSIIRSINVHDGQVVHSGEVLATLDPTFSTADVATLDRRVSSETAEIARLRAELSDIDYAPVPGDVFRDLQKRIFESRKSEYSSSLATYDQKLASTKASADQAQREIKFYSDRLKLLAEVEDMKQQLMTSKVGSRADFIQASDARIEIEGNLTSAQGRFQAASHELEAIQSERRTFIEKWKSDTGTELVTVQGQLDDSREQLAKADKRRDLIEMKAVEDAVVLQVGDISEGAVVESAKKMFSLVPLGAPLEVQAEIQSQDQGFVHVGQDVQLKLEAWPYSRHGTAEGIVRSISGDSFTMQQNGGPASQSVFLANIDVTSLKLHDVGPNFRLVPGMPLTADIVVGPQTIMSYLLGHTLPMMTEGLREP